MSENKEPTQMEDDIKSLAEALQFLIERFSYTDEAEGHDKKLQDLNKKLSNIIYRD